MLELRFLALIALGLWMGGLVALGGVVAPVLFTVLTAHDPAGGRSLAGLAFGAVLESYERVGLMFGSVVALTLAGRAARPPRPPGLAWRSLLVATMLGATVITGAVLAPRIEAIRIATTGAIADRPDTDPAKIAFGRLHGLSGGLMVGTLAGGLVLFWREMRDL